MTSAPSFYAPVIVPALIRIQQEHGYLQREALERFAKDAGVPLYRLQGVASFFPHFQLTPPRKVTVRVCRDMACRMPGSADLLRGLAATAGEQVTVEGASCLGRCDRAPAASVAVEGAEHESYFLRRSLAEWKEIVAAAVGDALPPHDEDAALAVDSASWRIDPYASEARDYLAVRTAPSVREGET